MLYQNGLTYHLPLEPTNFRAHDVGLNGLVFCPTVRPTDSPTYFGAWRSPVARLLWEQEVPGSNPGAPTRLSHIAALGSVNFSVNFTPSAPP